MSRIYNFWKIYLLLTIAILAALLLFSQETRQLATGKPQAVADLKTTEGAALVNASWYVQPAHIVDANFKSPGAAANDVLLLYPTGAAIKTHTIHPQINATDFNKNFMAI